MQENVKPMSINQYVDIVNQMYVVLKVKKTTSPAGIVAMSVYSFYVTSAHLFFMPHYHDLSLHKQHFLESWHMPSTTDR